jgi:hypothetical protein
VDETAREGAEQMAVDEALLDGAEHPILRVYRWPRESGLLRIFAIAFKGLENGIPCFRWCADGPRAASSSATVAT